jgi:hypothetical protein
MKEAVGGYGIEMPRRRATVGERRHELALGGQGRSSIKCSAFGSFSMCLVLSQAIKAYEWTFNSNVEVRRGRFGELDLRCKCSDTVIRAMFVVVIR